MEKRETAHFQQGIREEDINALQNKKRFGDGIGRSEPTTSSCDVIFTSTDSQRIRYFK
jgi:hypothetical protein